MHSELWHILSIVLLFAFGGSLYFMFVGRIKLFEARQHIQIAKAESEDIVQFLIRNPYPFIQASFDKSGGGILFANPAAYRHYPGLRKKGINHFILRDLPKILSHSMGQEIVREVIHDERAWAQTVVPIRRGGEEVYAIYCYDVSERKIFERQLDESRQVAEAANQSKSDFLANMSHELRTPMNGIIGLSSLLRGMPIDEKARELSDIVHQSARNLLALLNDILDFSKIEAGELSLEQVDFDLVSMVKQIIKLQKSVADPKNISLILECAPDLPTALHGDSLRLQQILNNLLSNALKFTEKGWVKISLSSHDQSNEEILLRIVVEDTGIGIPPHKLGSIFEKFTQADLSTSRKYGGTGLGLTITRQLTEMMGGMISVESVEGKGTCFYVTLPFTRAKGQLLTIEDRNDVSLSLNNEASILVVDDHPVNLFVMRNLLENYGFINITEAKSGKEALALIKNNIFNLILMDCQMPEMSGFETTEFIRREENLSKNNAVIIAVTADALKGVEEKCIASGMNDYISKPVEFSTLQSKLQKWLPIKNILPLPVKRILPETKTSFVFNQSQLDEFTSGDLSKEIEVMSLFAQVTQESILALQHSIQQKDIAAWKNHTHKLYGSSITFGAETFAAICHEAQNLSDAPPEQKEIMLGKITAHYQALNAYFEDRRKQA